MKLLGGERVGGDAGDYRMYAEMFERLPREVGRAGGVLRYMAYEGGGNAGKHVRFLGAEVASLARIPEGMAGWELGEHAWTIWRPGTGGPVAAWRGTLQWDWHVEGKGGEVGEFYAAGPAEWGNAEAVRMALAGHAHGAGDGRRPPDEVALADYDDAWPARFEAMAAWVRREVKVAGRVEHYGSTAIAGMPAKPVIDLLVEIPSFEAGKKEAIPRLNGQEWEYWWYSGHMMFIRREGFLGRRTHHLHLAPRGHEVWRGLAFREYLRGHADAARRYTELKRRLAAQHRCDREEYTRAKTAFVMEILAKTEGKQAAGAMGGCGR